MASGTQDLSVRSESVQRMYDLYLSDRFQVNRRYQRKLVWSVEEKEKLIDSIFRDLPLPLFLVAELATEGTITYELIDGLQRLNAIFAFLENEYSVGGRFFDLDSLADTKLRKDEGKLVQRKPILNREESAALANYTVALSVFRAADEASVEEVFRRINSGGRRLSRQSLRQAGTISSLADLVRVVSSRIRGDTSPSESVPLRRMPQLSITNYNLDYGVNVDEIFWVVNGILRREDVRESLDEQLVLDVLLDCLIEPLPTSGTRIRDEYYNYGDPDQGISRESLTIANAIETAGAENVADAFMRVYDEVRSVLAASGQKFSSLIAAGSGGRAPRYYHGVFMAFYELIVKDRLRVRDYQAAAAALTNIGSGSMNVPGGGGDWTGPTKRTTIDSVKGIIRSAFEGPIVGEDLAAFGYASQLETILSNALVEQQLFDCKQGLYSLAPVRKFDEDNFKKIAKTMSAMANGGKHTVGYVAVGIADTDADAQRITQLDGVSPILFRGFRVVGIGREALLRGVDLNDYWHWLIQKLPSTGLEPGLASSIANSARLVPYHQHAVCLFKVQAGDTPNFFDGKIYERSGSDTVQVPNEQYVRIFDAFR
ncbi:hypothetical protein BKG82_07105 [Mycobacteroides chelonae]|uniref:GmrSD restriction endonucleases N-terminal domain-containing protein n=2 Tax=Mycobacteriaceae TaxID=1762 RepID=A0A1S1LR19_MYCCH|nr:hypothetical protein AOT87_01860 [Mycobacteroides sp. H003]KRQ28632.1 hypothetical protein AOT91_17510 [Mycobacteroides sp. H092]KRQ44044.1 hypothetical protein AOT92_06815 [Mycobacteroides sp. H101]KRQ57378.1 hypothetical protein AOT94_15405 [Mycobacteroides sp. HXVII]KRQ61765.1 hypothetical protein AOT90_16750 [Mycobacteroides sp. H079]KRQ74639.1 hypothetical protein AOT95_27370 [Mycobacteroides sp. HXXIII]KRQ82029.1 hypothetical protein AOT93_10075 [Mycobacteroides sp. H110]OHU27682.1 